MASLFLCDTPARLAFGVNQLENNLFGSNPLSLLGHVDTLKVKNLAKEPNESMGLQPGKWFSE